jgi:anti-anti-sigma factor
MVRPLLTVERVDHHGVPALILSGEIDMSNGAEVEESASAFMGGPLVIDLDGVTFIDSWGLRSLVMLNQAHGDGMLVICANEAAAFRRLIVLTGLDGELPVVASRSEALERLRSRPRVV